MTKILYIPTGEFLHFNYRHGCSRNRNKRTVLYEQSHWIYSTNNSADEVITKLCECPDEEWEFREINELPKNLDPSEFEVVYDQTS